MGITFYEVGGAVRDGLLGIPSKDIDFVAVIEDSGRERVPSEVDAAFDVLRHHLEVTGFEIFVDTPEYFTLRARFPRTPPGTAWFDHDHYKGMTADFVLARREGPYSDGRRPDWVRLGTLEDDLTRRDFTVNSLARHGRTGEIIDLFGGQGDLAGRLLRCVGSAEDRFREDALRALRAIRFWVTKDFVWHPNIHAALCSDWLPQLLCSVSADRRRDELEKCFRKNTLLTLEILQHHVNPAFCEAAFAGGLWLRPTLKEA